jgi:predicted nucleotidyltransferase
MPGVVKSGAGPNARQNGGPFPNLGGHANEEAALADIVGRLRHALDPAAIYLFGSRARGTARPDSDFDLLVVMRPEDGEAGSDYERAHAPLLDCRVGCEVVPVPLSDFIENLADPTSLSYEARHRGRLLYER